MAAGGATVIFLALLACAPDKGLDVGTGEVPEELQGAVLRLEVHPPADTGLLSQTLWVERADEQAPVELRLLRTASVEGRLTGVWMTPWADADLPSQEGPLQATVTLGRETTMRSVSVLSDADGLFTLPVVPAADHILTVTHDDPDLPPYAQRMAIEGDVELDVVLAEGVPLWGEVVDGGGVALTGARVRAVGPDGMTTPMVTADAAGRYLLWVREGSWRVTCLGRDNGRDPGIAADVEVQQLGARQDFVFPALDLVTVGGRLLDPEGNAHRESLVRFTSVSLDGYGPEAFSVVEAVPSSTGTFDRRVLPGEWLVQVVPDADEDYPPLEFELDVSGDVDLGSLTLAPPVLVTGLVTDGAGEPIPRAGVQLEEIGVGQRLWTLTADSSGHFALPLPPVEIQATLSPPGDRTGEFALSRETFVPTPGGTPVLELEAGERLRGVVRGPDGERLAWTLVEVRDDAGRLWGAALTDEDGSFDVGVASTVE